MKAAVYHQHGGTENIRYEDVADPSPAADEVLIRVKAVSLNGFDPMMLNGTTSLKTPFPMSPGGDFAGEVVAAGSSVDANQWKVGDRLCPFPYIEGRGMIGETLPGACRELVVMPVTNLLRMPDALSFTDAATLPIAYGTALRMMRTRGAVTRGEKVLILGATGGVGTCAVQLAVAAGAEVIACGSAEWKLAKLQALGATHVIDSSKEDFLDVVRRLYGKPRFMGGGGVDVVVNYIGGDTWVRSLKALRHQGRLLVWERQRDTRPPRICATFWSFELQIIGSDGWTYEDQTALMNMVVAGTLKPVIHSVRPLAETADALQELIDRRVFGKSVLTAVSGRVTVLPTNLGHLFDVPLRVQPDAPAVLQGDVMLTFADLDRRCNRVANGLADLGVGTGDRVALMFSNDYRFIEALFGTMRLGGVPVPLNIRMGDDALRYVVDDSDAIALIVNSDMADRARSLFPRSEKLRHVIVDGRSAGQHVGGDRRGGTLDYEDMLRAALPHFTPKHTEFDDVALQPYTSGSTGKPKGVLLTHGGQIWNTDVLRKLDALDHTERALVAVPLYHKNAMAGAVKPLLLCGGSLVILPGFDPVEVIRAIERYRITYMTGVPAMYSMIFARKDELRKHDVSSLRYAACGSAEVSEELIEEFHWVFPGAIVVEGYGLTEGGPVPVAMSRYGLIRRGSCGREIPGCEVRIVGEDGITDLGANRVGELITRNPGLARGYWKLPSVTADRFRNGWLYTGDLAAPR